LVCGGLADANYTLIEIGFVNFFPFKDGMDGDGTTH